MTAFLESSLFLMTLFLMRFKNLPIHNDLAQRTDRDSGKDLR